MVVSDGGSDYLAMEFRRQKNALDLSYIVEVSNDLEYWTPASLQFGSPVDNGDGTETMTIRDSLAVPTTSGRFIRLRVTHTP